VYEIIACTAARSCYGVVRAADISARDACIFAFTGLFGTTHMDSTTSSTASQSDRFRDQIPLAKEDLVFEGTMRAEEDVRAHGPLACPVTGVARHAHKPATDDRLMTEPCPCSRIRGVQRFVPRKTPITFTPISSRYTSTVISSIGAIW